MSRSVTALDTSLENLRTAALDATRVAGLTHKFYRYPARFSPAFAATAIKEFSRRGDLVLDPYMGGGTTVVEALALGRRAAGSDLNSLAAFVTRVKTTPLSAGERLALQLWSERIVPALSYWATPDELTPVICESRATNLNLPIARPIKKILALGLLSLGDLPSNAARDFARCAMLNAGQWALNGRKRSTPLYEFRAALSRTVCQMLDGLTAFEQLLTAQGRGTPSCHLINDSAANLAAHEPFVKQKASLVVTSPPYPGIHMLYHRWQVDGRRESAAPYWLASCQDGQGAAFYNFADRRDTAIDQYFKASLLTLKGIRSVVKDGAYLVQMVAFGNPEVHLPRYLDNLEEAGFQAIDLPGNSISRRVPGRRWHASLKGALNGSREVVLIHRAI